MTIVLVGPRENMEVAFGPPHGHGTLINDEKNIILHH